MGAHLTYDEFKRSVEYIITSHDPPEWFPETSATWKWVCGGDPESVLMQGYWKIKKIQYNKPTETSTVVEYSICYSPCYENPVVYLSSYNDCGSYFDIEETLNSVGCPVESRKNLVFDQETHHLLDTNQHRCYKLHPCNTDILMRALVHEKDNKNKTLQECVKYMIAWMSALDIGLAPPAQVASRVIHLLDQY